MENENNEKQKIRASIIKVTIIAISILLSFISISISYYESNRYYYDRGFLIDKYNCTYIDLIKP